MNTRISHTLIAITLTFVFLLSACAPAAKGTPQIAPIAEATQAGVPVEVEKEVAKDQPVSPLPTQAPAAESLQVLPPAPTATPGGITLATPPADNYFQDYGVNPFEDPREDHLSTFSLDVDTASYSIARRYVMDGSIPPADSVRVEEFINYFNPGYPTPDDIAFAIYADGALSPFHTDGSYILRIGVQGYAVPESERKPASLTFVIDVSGSMAMENRLGLVQQSLQLLVERLQPSDSVAIVIYGTQARVVLTPTSAEDKQYILDAIWNLKTEGATNAEAGLRLGYQLAYQAFRPGAINRVILCSDGVANVGATGPDAILESIRGYADQGITLTSVGFGMGNFNDVLMEQLANNGDGTYAYVDDIDEAERLFVDNLTSTLQVIALDTKIQVDFNPDVVNRYRLIGYENRAVADQDFRNNAVDAGELGAGHHATALYAVILNPGIQGRIATVQLRWQNPDTLQVTEINGNFNTWDLSPSFESTSLYYQLAVVVSQYAELLRQSPYARGTSIGQILQHAVRLSGLLPRDADVSEFVTLVSRASQIQAILNWK